MPIDPSPEGGEIMHQPVVKPFPTPTPEPHGKGRRSDALEQDDKKHGVTPDAAGQTATRPPLGN